MREKQEGAVLFVIDRDFWPRAAKHEAFSHTKEPNDLQFSLKTQVLPLDNLRIGWNRQAVGKQVGKSALLRSAGKLWL